MLGFCTDAMALEQDRGGRVTEEIPSPPLHKPLLLVFTLGGPLVPFRRRSPPPAGCLDAGGWSPVLKPVLEVGSDIGVDSQRKWWANTGARAVIRVRGHHQRMNPKRHGRAHPEMMPPRRSPALLTTLTPIALRSQFQRPADRTSQLLTAPDRALSCRVTPAARPHVTLGGRLASLDAIFGSVRSRRDNSPAHPRLSASRSPLLGFPTAIQWLMSRNLSHSPLKGIV